jgi:predicted RNA-binding Zn-ribbon protein involved in translation (DUF1610 family)
MAEVKLDPDTDEVICLQCGDPIKTVTSFIKVELRTKKQFVKRASSSSSFAVQCGKCGKKVRPIPDGKGFNCPECKAKIAVSKAFENVLREQFNKSRRPADGTTKPGK